MRCLQIPAMNRFLLFIVAAMLGTAPVSVISADSDPAIVRAFRTGNEAVWADIPVYIARIYAERFFLSLGAACPRAGVGYAPGHPAATLYAATPTLLFNPSYFMAVQLLKANEVKLYLDATQPERDARQLAESSKCNPAALQRITADMARHLKDPKLAGPTAATLAAQCKTRPNRWDGSPCDCIGQALDMAATPRSRRMLVDDLWGSMEELIGGDSRLYNLSMVACTKAAPMTEVHKPSYDQLGRGQKFLSSSRDAVSTALRTVVQFEAITLPDEVIRPLYEHAFPLWSKHGEPSLILTCFYGLNNQAKDNFVVMFWAHTVFIPRSEFARLSPRHPLMLVAEAVRKTCPEIEEARGIRAASRRAAKDLGYH